MKKNTYIDTYNQITSNYDVSDCNKFLTNLDSNYEKFKYFHRLIRNIDYEFNFYEMEHDDFKLVIKIIPKNKIDLGSIISSIKENINNTDSRDLLFEISLVDDIDEIIITISCDKLERKLMPLLYKNMTFI